MLSADLQDIISPAVLNTDDEFFGFSLSDDDDDDALLDDDEEEEDDDLEEEGTIPEDVLGDDALLATEPDDLLSEDVLGADLEELEDEEGEGEGFDDEE